jgi:hypothetical protein
MSETVFVRLLMTEEKNDALLESVSRVTQGNPFEEMVYLVEPPAFKLIPGSPFAYWVSDRMRSLFATLPAFESQGRWIERGMFTGDDFRFLRAYWEIAPSKLLQGTWCLIAKGGEYSPFYGDVYLCVLCEQDFAAIKQFVVEKYPYLKGDTDWVLHPDCSYKRPGFMWSRRSQRGMSPRVLAAGSYFSDKSPTAFAPQDMLLPLVALTNSPAFQWLVALQMAFGSYEVGIVKTTPIPLLRSGTCAELSRLCLECVHLTRSLDAITEVSHAFMLPALLQGSSNTLTRRFSEWQQHVVQAQQTISQNRQQVDQLAFQLYGIEGKDRNAVEASMNPPGAQRTEDSTQDSDEESVPEPVALDHRAIVSDLLSYCVGCVFGRWDVRFATGAKQPPPLPDPFAPLPVCSPGMLTGADGLPLTQSPPDYPIRNVAWSGILVDEDGHQDDIVRRVRDVLHLIWGDREGDIEAEACQILGVRELRDYFRKPGAGGFWADHVRRYSKSRRKAPIYWLLQSGKKNYALWLYYHRLHKDLLYQALRSHVEPRLRLESDKLDTLRTQKGAAGDTGRAARQLERDIDRQEALLSELHEFHDALRRAADLGLTPDLNDGVVLTIAPLWEVVPWREAKAYWDDLLAGEYEWSSIGNQLRAKGIVKG